MNTVIVIPDNLTTCFDLYKSSSGLFQT